MSGPPRPVQVAHVTIVHPDDDTRVFWKECVGLARRGFDVSLVVPSERGSRREEGVDVVALSRPARRVTRVVSSALEALRHVRERRSDLVHLHDPELLLWLPLWRRFGRIVVYDMHEQLPAQVLAKEWLPRWSRRLVAGAAHVFERWAYRRLPIVMAERSYEEAYPFVRRRTTVRNLPALAALDAVPRGTPFASPTVGYLGRVTEARGVPAVARALRKLRDEGLDVRFLCMGTVDAEVRNDPTFSRGVRDGWIRAPGRVAPRDGWRELARCAVGVAVLKRTPNYERSYPTKMFEYMGLGLPVIVSDFALYRDVVEPSGCGVTVDPDDESALTAALRAIVTRPEAARVMGRRGRAAVEARYRWEHELDELERFYADLLDERSSSNP